MSRRSKLAILYRNVTNKREMNKKTGLFFRPSVSNFANLCRNVTL